MKPSPIDERTAPTRLSRLEYDRAVGAGAVLEPGAGVAPPSHAPNARIVVGELVP